MSTCSALSTLPCLLSCFHNERIKWNAIPGGGELPSKVTALATLAEEDGPCKPWEPRIQSVFGWYLQQLQVSLVHLSNDQQICAQSYVWTIPGNRTKLQCTLLSTTWKPQSLVQWSYNENGWEEFILVGWSSRSWSSLVTLCLPQQKELERELQLGQSCRLFEVVQAHFQTVHFMFFHVWQARCQAQGQISEKDFFQSFSYSPERKWKVIDSASPHNLQQLQQNCA